MTDTTPPTPYGQFCFFKSLSYSLYEYDWYNFVEQWQAMVAVNAPLPEFTNNLVPFFSNARRLVPVFHRYIGHVRQNQEFLNTLTNVLMSTPLMIKVQSIVHSPLLFADYVAALKLDNPSASHTQVMQSLQSFLSALPAPTRLQVQRAFAEAEASDSMGLSSSTLETAFHLLHSDIQLYIDVLTTMQLNQTRNMHWNTVVSKIKAIVTAKKPYAWPGMDQFLQRLHWGHYHGQYGYSTQEIYNQEYLDDYADYENDEVLERVEGVDYHADEQDEREIGGSYSGDNQAFESSLNEAGSGAVNAAETVVKVALDHSAGRNVAEKFADMSVTDKRPIVATF